MDPEVGQCHYLSSSWRRSYHYKNPLDHNGQPASFPWIESLQISPSPLDLLSAVAAYGNDDNYDTDDNCVAAESGDDYDNDDGCAVDYGGTDHKSWLPVGYDSAA